jgi:UDP-N-acetylenolpyruvoylglucosamine reductase
VIQDRRAATVAPREHVPLASFSTLGVGGPARWYVHVESIERVQAAHHWAADRAIPVFILGGGSNVVVADEGFPGLVLHVAATKPRSLSARGSRGTTSWLAS